MQSPLESNLIKQIYIRGWGGALAILRCLGNFVFVDLELGLINLRANIFYLNQAASAFPKL